MGLLFRKMMEATAGVFIFVFLTFLDTIKAQAQDGNAKIWNDSDCPNVGTITNCQDVDCCKAECTKKKGCTAVNFKPGDCILRACKCTGVVEPTWTWAGYKGYSVDGSVNESDKLWNDKDCPNLEINKDCQDVECCKTACKAKDKCTAVNFKPGDCVLRDSSASRLWSHLGNGQDTRATGF